MILQLEIQIWNCWYDKAQLASFEMQFQHLSGIVVGVQMGLSDADRESVKLSFLSDEAVGTAEIEGELLDRVSVQSSIQQYFNLKPSLFKSRPRENGIARDSQP